MQITIRYGIDTMNKDVPENTTIQQLMESDSIRAGLGFGDNVKALIAGQEMPPTARVPANATVVFETLANSKASGGTKQVTLRYGVDSITKAVDEDTTIGDLLDDDDMRAALGYGDNVKAFVQGAQQGPDTYAPATTSISLENAICLETAANEKANA